MRQILIVLSSISLFLGLLVFFISKGAIQEIESIILFTVSAILYSGYAIVRSIEGKEINSSTHVKCSDCLEYVLIKSKKCKHCGSNVTPYPELTEKLPFKDYV
jgi:hypothetical protein